jgi:hypothetical protein
MHAQSAGTNQQGWLQIDGVKIAMMAKMAATAADQRS